MNLLEEISKSSKRKGNQQYPWFSHRYVGRLLILAVCVFIYEYYSQTKSRSFFDIEKYQTLNVAYIKSPDVLFEIDHRPIGFQYEVISAFAENIP